MLDAGAPEVVRDAARHADRRARAVPRLLEVAEAGAAVPALVEARSLAGLAVEDERAVRPPEETAPDGLPVLLGQLDVRAAPGAELLLLDREPERPVEPPVEGGATVWLPSKPPTSSCRSPTSRTLYRGAHRSARLPSQFLPRSGKCRAGAALRRAP